MASSRELLPLWRSFANINKLRQFSMQGKTVMNLQCRCTSTEISSGRPETKGNTKKAETISRAMKAYLERAKSHELFMQKEVAGYEIGKRHLAMIMGADPENFTQEDIDIAIQYLLPSGLFNRRARPIMKHPSKIVPKNKVAQFDMDGRPFDPFFYTGSPNYYSQMHDLGMIFEELKVQDTSLKQKGMTPIRTLQLSGSQWADKNTVAAMFDEEITEGMYKQLIQLLGRIAEQPWSHRHEELIFKFRKMMSSQASIKNIPEPLISESGQPYQVAEGSRKTAKATLTLWDQGTGQVSINGKDLLTFFPNIVDREQIMFPLQFTNKLGLVDFEAVVQDGGHSGQAGALRLALSRVLCSFVSQDTIEKMRLAGLLTRDPRMRERKKYGQEGARRKYTWKKR